MLILADDEFVEDRTITGLIYREYITNDVLVDQCQADWEVEDNVGEAFDQALDWQFEENLESNLHPYVPEQECDEGSESASESIEASSVDSSSGSSGSSVSDSGSAISPVEIDSPPSPDISSRFKDHSRPSPCARKPKPRFILPEVSALPLSKKRRTHR